MSVESQVYDEVESAMRHLRRAYELNTCRLCREDIGLVLGATVDLATIAGVARGLEEHPHRLKAIRTLAANLDELHLLSLLVLLDKTKVISKILRIGSRNEQRD